MLLYNMLYVTERHFEMTALKEGRLILGIFFFFFTPRSPLVRRGVKKVRKGNKDAQTENWCYL